MDGDDGVDTMGGVTVEVIANNGESRFALILRA